jgi:glycosyltransferase involved in cell wall biosynthesis
MLIGIDASRAVAAAPTGTETYSHEIISALLQADSPFRFRLYTRAVPDPPFPSLKDNYQVRTIPFPRLWTHLRLSAEMIKYSPDALFVPSHVLPLAHPRRSLVTVHDLGYLHFPETHRAFDRWYLKLSTHWNVRTAECVIVDSNATRLDLIRFYHLDEPRVRVISPALRANFLRRLPDPTKITSVKSRYGIDGDYLISVGTIHPRKNYERLIRAFQNLPDKYQLVIVGKKGWMFHKILASPENLHLGGRVKFLDYVSETDLPSLYCGARLAVFPSLYEGFGFPILEAQACGTPVVCSNTSSLPEVAADGAVFFDPLDSDAISRAVVHVLDDVALRKELIEKGHANLNRYSWERAAQQILAEITSL